MKYTILGFNQKKAIEYGLDTDDLLILRWFIDFKGTDKMSIIEENGKIYYWINYSKIIEDIPILNVTKERIKKKHFNKLCESMVLNHKHSKDGGSYSYYSLGENYLSLIEEEGGRSKITEGRSEMTEGVGQNEPRGSVKNDRTNIDILYNSSISNNISSNSYNMNEYNIYEFVEKNYGRTISSFESEKIKYWVEKYGEEVVKYAFEISIMNNKKILNYVNSILQNWGSCGYKTVEDIKTNEKIKHKKEEIEQDKEIDLSVLDFDWFKDDFRYI